MKAVIAVLVLLAAAFLLNPGADAHRDKLQREIAARSRIAGLLRLGNLAALASSYHTLGVASYSKINDRVVTYGAFGVVFVPDLERR
jgi:hypothetical protein